MFEMPINLETLSELTISPSTVSSPLVWRSYFTTDSAPNIRILRQMA